MFSAVSPLLYNLFLTVLCILIVIIVLSILAKIIEPKKGDCKCKERLDGKTVLITGGNSGIGLETARDLAKRGARVIIASRDVKKSAEAVQDIKDTTGNNSVDYKHLNLASFDSVKTFAEEFNKTYDRLDILVNNAGCYGMPKKVTKDGNDVVMQINYLGQFLLTNLLLEKLIASKPSRIILVSSFTHHMTIKFRVNHIKGVHRGWLNNRCTRYGNSKLCQVLWMKALAKRLPRDVTVNSVHPGLVNTGIFVRAPLLKLSFDAFLSLISKTPVEGAQTLIHLAVSKDLDNKTGGYYSECTPARISTAVNDDLAEAVYNESVKITGSEFKF